MCPSKIKNRMKKLLLVIVSLVSLAAYGQSDIKFDAYEHNFGVINETDGVVSHTFTYTNNSNQPHVIITVALSCGCTQPVYSREPLPAGGSAKFTIRFDPADRPGRFEKNIQINSNLGTAEITISGVVTPRPRTVKDIFPFVVGSQIRADELLVRVDPAPRSRAVSRNINIVNDSFISASISIDTTLLPDWVSAKLSANYLEPAQKGAITVVVNSDLRWGLQSCSIPIIVNGRMQAEKLWVTAIFADDFSKLTAEQRKNAPKAEFSTYFYHFSTQKVGKKVTTDVKIKNSGATPLYIRHIEGSKGASGVMDRTTIAPYSTANLKITIAIDSPEPINESIRVITSDPTSPVREIRLMATGI